MWPPDGVVILRDVLDHDLIDAYVKVREPLGPVGFTSPTAHMQCQELRDLACSFAVSAAVEDVAGEPAAMHLNLTGWVSSERTWHQDDYLNPVPMGDRYCGAWMALDDIDPDSGPFQFVPGSHLWHFLSQGEVLDRLSEEEQNNPAWPRVAERFVTDYWQQMIDASGAQVQSFDAKRGDLLLWHSRLLHCGSAPAQPGIERRSLIAHRRSSALTWAV